MNDCLETNDRQQCGCERVGKRQNLLFYPLAISLLAAPSEPLLCKFADGGQKKRQSQNKFGLNGRAWARDGDSRLVSGTQHGVTGTEHIIGNLP